MYLRNKTISDTKLSVDGASYYGCTFQRCTLQHSGLLPVTLEGCFFDNCKWEFLGPASNTLAFMTALYKGGAADLIEATFNNIRGKPQQGPTLN
jgi:hypothetical protein